MSEAVLQSAPVGPKLTVVRRGASVVVRKPYLPAERFPDYQRAVDGVLRYDRELRVRAAPLEKAPALVTRLKRAGFDARFDVELRTFFQKRQIAEWYELQALTQRLTMLDAEVFARTGNHLFLHQCTGAMWLSRRRTALLADEMGLGKTLTLILSIPSNAPTLIVAPASMKYEWVEELRKWRPQLRAQVLEGRGGFRWPKEGEILIINYDILPDVHDREGKLTGRACDGFYPPEPCLGCKDALQFNTDGAHVVRDGHLDTCTGFRPERRMCAGCHPLLEKATPGTVLIDDEIQYAKGGRSQMGIRSRALTAAVLRHDGRTWGATGTPMENGPKELWNVFRACGIAEECFGDWATFERLFKGKLLEYGYEWGMPDEEVVERIQRGALRRMRKDCLDLPPKIRKELPVDIDRATFQQLDRFVANFEGGLPRLIELLQKDKVPFELMSAVRSALATAKIPALLEILRSEVSDSADPVIVYSMHRPPIDTVGKLPGWEVIHGDVPLKRRREIVQQFQCRHEKRKIEKERCEACGRIGRIRGLGVTIQAAGVGLTLTRACRGYYVDQSWNPAENVQSEDRMMRIGQTRGVVYVYLKAKHALDERVVEVLLEKQARIDASVNAATTVDDVPIEKLKHEYEADIRAAQAEIASGAAVRRAPEVGGEIEALEKLHTFVFPTASDERLASDLAEQAEAIGLSSAQWALVVRLAERGAPRQALAIVEEEAPLVESERDGDAGRANVPVSPVSPEERIREKKLRDMVQDHRDRVVADRHQRDEEDLKPVTAADLLALARDMDEEERGAAFRLLDDVERDEPAAFFVRESMILDDEERGALEDALDATYCRVCGSAEHRQTDCPELAEASDGVVEDLLEGPDDGDADEERDEEYVDEGGGTS